MQSTNEKPFFVTKQIRKWDSPSISGWDSFKKSNASPIHKVNQGTSPLFQDEKIIKALDASFIEMINCDNLL